MALFKKEKCKFQISLTIREVDGKLVKLNKKVYLEITWEGNKGILNPSEEKKNDDEWSKDFGTVSYKVSKGSKVRFEKDGKNYDIIVKINEIKKGWFRDEVREIGGFSPVPGSDFTIGSEEKLGSPYEPEERMICGESKDWKIKPIQLRWSGPVLVGIVFLLLLLIIIIIIYSWKKDSPNNWGNCKPKKHKIKFL